MKKKLKAVIDTNIFVSALLGAGTCRFIVEYLEKRKFLLILSEFIINEIKNVFIAKDIGHISAIDVEKLFKTINITAKIVRPTIKLKICRDPEDNKILEAALEAKAEYIVTGDADLFCLKDFPIPIISPKEFLKIVNK